MQHAQKQRDISQNICITRTVNGTLHNKPLKVTITLQRLTVLLIYHHAEKQNIPHVAYPTINGHMFTDKLVSSFVNLLEIVVPLKSP